MDKLVLASLLLALLVWLFARWLKKRSQSRRKLEETSDPSMAAEALLGTPVEKPDPEIQELGTLQAPETLELSEEEAQALLARLQKNAMEESRSITQAAREQAQEERRKADEEQAALAAREAELAEAKQAAALKQAQEEAQRLEALAKQQQEELALERARQEVAIEAERAQKQASEEQARQQALKAAQREAAEQAAKLAALEQEALALERARQEAALQAEREQKLAAEEKAQQQALEAAQREAAEQAAKDAALEAARQQALRPPPTVTPQPTKTPEQTVVMVADDSKVVRVKASRLLAKHQFQVLLAQDGADAAQQMTQRVPDVLITDVEMPGMDGFELTRHVRSNPLMAHMHIIMITGADDKHREAAEEVGINVLLGKPYEDDELIAGIQRSPNLVS